jgi:hypothetical protein
MRQQPSAPFPRIGLRKAKAPALYVSRLVTHVRSEDARWRDLFERADIVSEGKCEHGEYRGTTHVLLPLFDQASGAEEHAFAAAMAPQCMHVRLRALRIARREAQHRAGVSLEPSRCELRFSTTSEGGVKIEVDVEANLVKRHTGTR